MCYYQPQAVSSFALHLQYFQTLFLRASCDDNLALLGFLFVVLEEQNHCCCDVTACLPQLLLGFFGCRVGQFLKLSPLVCWQYPIATAPHVTCSRRALVIVFGSNDMIIVYSTTLHVWKPFFLADVHLVHV